MPFLKKIYILIFCTISLLLGACTPINAPETPIPAYIHIAENVLLPQAQQGTSLHNLKTVWVNVNGVSVGTYELPATIPVILSSNSQTENVDIQVFTGITRNGINANRYIYPFLNTYNVTLPLTPNQTTTITPIFTYTSTTVFDFITDFELFSNFEVATQGTAPLQIANGGLQQNAAFVSLNSNTNTLFLRTYQTYPLPGAGAPVFLELHYKNTEPFTIAIEGVNPLGLLAVVEIATVYPHDTWNKFYAELTTAVSTLKASNYTNFRIILKAQKNTQNGIETASFWFDNIQLLHLN